MVSFGGAVLCDIDLHLSRALVPKRCATGGEETACQTSTLFFQATTTSCPLAQFAGRRGFIKHEPRGKGPSGNSVGRICRADWNRRDGVLGARATDTRRAMDLSLPLGDRLGAVATGIS